MEKVMDKIERFKLLAHQFKGEGKKIFLKNIYDDLFFATIVEIEEHKIIIDCFGPKQRDGDIEKINWLNISEFDEYEDRGNGK